ncbi:MAG TPA: hypothetical protein K8W08_04770 [Empedobacter falsenii]|nr:hypothetical protein [Empedobacter falsenii]
MKNLKIKYLFGLLLTLFMIGVNAQQTISFGEVKVYAVDEADGKNGTPGSTYEWKVLESNFSGTYTSVTTSGNQVEIDWGTTAVGIYTLQVVEKNEGCVGDKKQITVTINAVNQPTLTSDNTSTCFGVAVDFNIENAPAGSKVKYTIEGGTIDTANTANPVLIDTNGEAKIYVIPDTGSTEIKVTLTKMELSNGTIVNIDPDVSHRVIVLPEVITSDIDFEK